MYIDMHICWYIRVLYTVWCLSNLYAHKNICKTVCGKTATAQIGTNVRALVYLMTGLLVRSQFASGRSCDRPTPSRLPVVFLRPRANTVLALKFQVALHASHTAHSLITLKISPYINITLTFDFHFGLHHPVYGGYGWGDLAFQVGGVSDKTAIYAIYGSCATPTSEWLHCKLQTRLLVREGALHEEERK
jgi:hypothetical protein